MTETGFLILMIGTFLCVLLFAEILHHGLKIRGDLTRAFIQCFAGLFGLVYPYAFDSPFPAVIITVFFILLTHYLNKYGQLQSLFDIGRHSLGVPLFLIGFLIVYLVFLETHAYVFVLLPCFFMAFSDSAASIVGTIWPWKKYSVFGSIKTVSGSIAFFVIGLVSTLFIFDIYLDNFDWKTRLLFAVSISLSCTAIEAVSVRGTDNISVPFVVVLWLYFIDTISPSLG